MRHESELAIALNETIAATRLASDPKQLNAAPAADLVRAAAVLSKALVRAVDAQGCMKATRAAAVDLLDDAGRAIGAELRRRRIARQRGRLMVAAGHASAKNRRVLGILARYTRATNLRGRTMARITIDDALARIPNRFDLTLAATNRARQISAGSEPLLDADRDKPTVIALREIAAGLVGIEMLLVSTTLRRSLVT